MKIALETARRYLLLFFCKNYTEQRMEAQLFNFTNGAIMSLMISIGDQLGIFKVTVTLFNSTYSL